MFVLRAKTDENSNQAFSFQRGWREKRYNKKDDYGKIAVHSDQKRRLVRQLHQNPRWRLKRRIICLKKKRKGAGSQKRLICRPGLSGREMEVMIAFHSQIKSRFHWGSISRLSNTTNHIGQVGRSDNKKTSPILKESCWIYSRVSSLMC